MSAPVKLIKPWAHPFHEYIRSIAKLSYELPNAYVYVIDLDFDVAAKALERRPENQRPIDVPTIKKYERQLLAGEFRVEIADAISFDADGNLINGQHRCGAVVGCSGEAVMRDVEVKFLKYASKTEVLPFDSQRGRSQRDHLKWLGVAAPRSVSAGIIMEHCQFSKHHMAALSNPERARVIAESPMLDDLRSIRGVSKLPAGVVAGAIACIRANRDAVRFFDHVAQNDHEIDGRYDLNIKYLATWVFDRKTRSFAGDTFQRESVYRAIRAWNGYRSGEQPKMMHKYSVNYPLPEPRL